MEPETDAGGAGMKPPRRNHIASGDWGRRWIPFNEDKKDKEKDKWINRYF